MADREKVIKGLHKCTEKDFDCGVKKKECPYYDWYEAGTGTCIDILMADALTLLKAQEPKPVHVTAEINHRKVGECPNCGKVINSGDYPNYCGQCGQAVKW